MATHKITYSPLIGRPFLATTAVLTNACGVQMLLNKITKVFTAEIRSGDGNRFVNVRYLENLRHLRSEP